MKKHLLLFILFTNALFQLPAQVELIPERFVFEPGLTYDPLIPSPENFLGYRLGESFTVYAKAVEYFQALAEASERVVINQYGKTYEGRPLINLIITSETNQQQLEQVRTDHFRLTDPTATTSAEAEERIASQPVFISYSYNIHGNEASSTEAAMQVAYRLAAATDTETREILENSVLIMYICVNPDGRDRYVYWANSVARAMPGLEPNDLEHYEPWPNGRTNHYWFDVNRDWIWGIHPESRGLTAEYQRWMPQVHVDYHEQGYNSNYFTMPGTTPRNLLLPDDYEPLSDYFGRANIAEFDKYQLSYFTRDRFDFFYPSYGSSYPSVLGAIGMLTEQGGIGAGRAVETEDGYVLTFRQRIFDHYTTSLATIRASVARKAELLRYSYEAWQPSASKAGVKAYFLPAGQGGYLEDVIAILLNHGVRVSRAAGDFSVNAVRSYRTGKTAKGNFKAGDYIVSTDQARHLLIHSLLETALEIEDSVMYDMATWSAPLAYNLEVFSADRMPVVKSEAVTKANKTAGTLENPQARYAFVIDWAQRNAPRALALLWQKEYRVRSAVEPFSDDDGTMYPAGSLIILAGRNRERLTKMATDMADIAEAAGVLIRGYETGRMKAGYDLANTRNRPVAQPKVALLVEPPFDTYTCGQIYFLFDQETQLPVERIRTSVLQQSALPKFGERYGLANIHDYDVLILAGGGEHLAAVFDSVRLQELKSWLEAGGTLIATESAAGFFTAKKSKLTKAKWLEVKKDSSVVANYLPYAGRESYYGKKRIPGSALRARVDLTHPLAFGLKPDLFTLKFGSDALEPDPDLETVGHYERDPTALLAGGYASPENLAHLAGKTFAAVWPMGEGKIVFLLDNTQYRMFWRGPSRMMQNAAMLLPGF